jgi:hypothetical protein
MSARVIRFPAERLIPYLKTHKAELPEYIYGSFHQKPGYMPILTLNRRAGLTDADLTDQILYWKNQQEPDTGTTWFYACRYAPAQRGVKKLDLSACGSCPIRELAASCCPRDVILAEGKPVQVLVSLPGRVIEFRKKAKGEVAI